ncbi:MAG: AmmeMemoRadiSam system radical SAM enzyme [bacterium]
MSTTLQCELCPRECVIGPGQSGDCRIRVNLDGRLVAVTYGFPCSVHVDPVEKKPVFHFLPGTGTFSLATAGCNLHCKNCQNWEISQQNPDVVAASPLPPEQIPRLAQRTNCRSVSYTYSDPVVFYEYTFDTCVRVREAGLRNILVTAGYISRNPARDLFAHVDVARIDLKAMSEKFYRDVCSATLKPVLDTLELARDMGLWIEVIHLIIPTLNDRDADLTALCRWVRSNLGPDVPIHFSRFHPQYRLNHLPPTPAETLNRARDIAVAEGLNYVYLGNILQEGAEDTVCPGCKQRVIRRTGFSVIECTLKDGHCPSCGKEIPGRWI